VSADVSIFSSSSVYISYDFAPVQ